jgi:acetyl-CoA acetyltransferase family protein
MTRAPWVMAKPGTPWARPGEIADTALGWRLVNPRMRDVDGGRATITLGDTAEEVAALDGITREECDAWALRSQERAARAQDKGFFEAELVPVSRPKGEPVTRDETPRPDSTAEGLARLQPSFRPGGVVTAGNASPLSDGASAIVVASGGAIGRYGLVPRARVVAGTSAGVPPHLMGLGPVPATQRLLDRVGLGVDDLDAVELNEAFAAQVLACVRRLGLDEERLNADGGAIALGHPLGSSGSRLLVTLLGRLEREGGGRGLVTLCVGVGQGTSLLVERV